MKEKIRYGIIIVLMIAGFCFGLNHFYGIFMPYNRWIAKHDIKAGEIQIVQFEEIDGNFQQINELAKKYGFTFCNLGCVIRSAEIKGIDDYNNVVREYLDTKNEKGWWIKFQKEIDNMNKQPSANSAAQRRHIVYQ